VELELQIAAFENVSLLRCRGRLTYGPETVEFVRATRQTLETTKEIVLQMAEVTRIDSGGVGALGSVLITARKRNAEIKLAMLHPRVAEVLRITGLELLFDIHTSTPPKAKPLLHSRQKATRLDEVREERQLSSTGDSAQNARQAASSAKNLAKE
jgi:anti-sigma B factor antagonist